MDTKKWKELSEVEKYNYTKTDAWKRSEIALIRSFAPDIYACIECGNPRVMGYGCNYCGSVD